MEDVIRVTVVFYNLHEQGYGLMIPLIVNRGQFFKGRISAR